MQAVREMSWETEVRSRGWRVLGAEERSLYFAAREMENCWRFSQEHDVMSLHTLESPFSCGVEYGWEESMEAGSLLGPGPQQR